MKILIILRTQSTFSAKLELLMFSEHCPDDPRPSLEKFKPKTLENLVASELGDGRLWLAILGEPRRKFSAISCFIRLDHTLFARNARTMNLLHSSVSSAIQIALCIFSSYFVNLRTPLEVRYTRSLITKSMKDQYFGIIAHN